MVEYFKIYIYGLLATWFILYGGILLLSGNWLWGTVLVVVACVGLLELLVHHHHFGR